MDSDGNLLERINREAYGFGVTNKTLAMPIVNKQKAIHLASCTTRWNFTYSTSQPIPYLGASTVVRLSHHPRISCCVPMTRCTWDLSLDERGQDLKATSVPIPTTPTAWNDLTAS